MEEKNSPVKEALIQMKQVEEAIAENAKGILASTMKEEINQLVKESLKESRMDDNLEMDDQDETDVESDDVDYSDEFDDTDVDNQDEIPQTMGMDSDEPIDLTDASDEEILKVFKAMGEDDGIIVKKEGGTLHLKDNEADTEYLVRLGESINETDMNQFDEADDEEIMKAIFSDKGASDYEPEGEDVVYEIHLDDEGMGSDSYDLEEDEDPLAMEEEDSFDSLDQFDIQEEDSFNALDQFDIQEDEDPLAMESSYMTDEDYMTDEGYMMDEEMYEADEYEGDFDDLDDIQEDDDPLAMEEDEDPNVIPYDEMSMKGLSEGTYNPKKTKKGKKYVGVKGHGPKFTYSKTTGGFKEDMKQGPKSVGTGSAKKFKYSSGENLDGKPKMVKKSETKEASRTFGFGSKEGRGLRKGITPNRNFVYGKGGLKKESLETEVSMLREKNEEYRKALNVFREKLNEVAIFNSNLAYATRLFTEHSTTKKEKINILRRFDGVETLKESKNLYRSIREELNKGENKSINESVETKLNKNVSSGSSTTLIESKTYENPQFMRMKDLMSKLG